MLFIVTSCKKDYVCDCYATGTTVVIESIQINNMTKKNAEAKCDSYDGSVNLAGQIVAKDCSLK